MPNWFGFSSMASSWPIAPTPIRRGTEELADFFDAAKFPAARFYRNPKGVLEGGAPRRRRCAKDLYPLGRSGLREARTRSSRMSRVVDERRAKYQLLQNGEVDMAGHMVGTRSRPSMPALLCRLFWKGLYSIDGCRLCAEPPN